MMERSSFIDYCRGYAILTIVIFHFFSSLPLSKNIQSLLNLGGGGVHAFIFASGYGLALSKKVTYETFISKRFKKVILPYFIVITAIFLLNIVLKAYPFSGLIQYIGHIFLFKMFIEEYQGSFGVHFWFISTIVQFYLIFPFLNKIIRPSLSSLLVCFVISILYSGFLIYIGKSNYRVYNSFFLQYLWEFVLGMIIAQRGLLERILNTKLLYQVVTALSSYVIMWLLVKMLGDIGKVVNDVFSFTGYMFTCIVIYKLTLKNTILSNLFIKISVISYPLYLIHYFLLDTSKKYLANQENLGYYLPVILIITLIISYYIHVLFKKVSLA